MDMRYNNNIQNEFNKLIQERLDSKDLKDDSIINNIKDTQRS